MDALTSRSSRLLTTESCCARADRKADVCYTKPKANGNYLRDGTFSVVLKLLRVVLRYVFKPPMSQKEGGFVTERLPRPLNTS